MLSKLFQLKNYTIAYAKWVAAGKPIREKDHIEILFQICENCPTKQFLRITTNKGQCKKCGCWLHRINQHTNKLAWPTEACPDGHWLAQVEEE